MEYWSAVDEAKPFAQGDIIRAFPGGLDGEPIFGLIITADCDIVQSKAFDRLTYIEVVSTRNYLERLWIPDQLQKFVKKHAKVAVEGLSAAMRRSGLNFTLSDDQLVEWLRTRPIEVIEKATNRTGKPLDGTLSKNLHALRCALRGEDHADPVLQWRTLRDMLGDTREKQAAELAGALSGGGGFPDFFLLPELPGASGVGYVALLRFIQTVDAAQVFSTEVDARVQGRPDALHRVGRLPDGLRFAITQKLAFLFSRIGLPTHFENASKSAALLAAENLFIGV